MESIRTFKTTVLTEKDVQQRQEKQLENPKDFFKVDDIHSAFSDLRSAKDRHASRPNELTKSLVDLNEATVNRKIQMSQQKFLKQEAVGGLNLCSAFLRTLYASTGSFFIERAKKQEGNDGSGVVSLGAFSQAVIESIRENNIPSEIWLSGLDAYKARIERVDVEIQEMLPMIKQIIVGSFLKRINPALEYPLSQSDLDDVMCDVSIRVKDPLLVRSAEGTYVSDSKIISLDLIVAERMLAEESEADLLDGLQLVAHEALHAISAEHVVQHELKHEFASGGDMTHTSSGAQWIGLEVNGFKTKRFTWINEAVTELLSARMFDVEPVSYKKEIELFKLLLSKGAREIDERKVFNAYFENKKFNGNSDDIGSLWKSFRQEIKEAYPHDPHFFVSLDLFIQKNGIESAIEIFKNWNASNPPRLEVGDNSDERSNNSTQ